MQTLQSSTSSYADDAVRRILARAAEIEEADHSNLPVAQIEALGQELGLSPEAVRQALGEQGAATIVNSTVAREASSVRLSQSPTQASFKTALLPGLWYALFSGIAMFISMCVQYSLPFYYFDGKLTLISITQVVTVLSLFFLPLVISFYAGWRSHHVRSGALGGFVLGLATFAVNTCVCLPFLIQHNEAPPPPAWILFLLMIPFCSISGAVGGKAWSCWNNLARNEDR